MKNSLHYYRVKRLIIAWNEARLGWSRGRSGNHAPNARCLAFISQ